MTASRPLLDPTTLAARRGKADFTVTAGAVDGPGSMAPLSAAPLTR